MAKVIETVLKMMPVWFGIGFLGPVLAEFYLRTPLGGAISLDLNNSQIYMLTMSFGGVYGIIAWRTGRWV